MRCKIHSSDPGAGVCACCLRERLSALASSAAGKDSVPPTSSRQKSDLSSARQSVLCHRPARHSVSGSASSAAAITAGGCGGGKPPIVPPISGDPNLKRSESDRFKSSKSNFWLVALIRGRGKGNKKASPQVSSVQEDVGLGQARKPHVPEVIGRGLSPAPEEETAEYTSDGELTIARRLPSRSPTTQKSTVAQHGKGQANQNPRSISSLALCLSPLVGPSHSNRRSFATPEVGFTGGEIRGTFNRRCERVAVPDASFVLGPNRSRKLVDLGKAW
ncbi:hypothetical protein HPP92_014219 [Vanilla planifolia]|uniref:Uncharacterized protein n=1 Tax=Vanilla planifolia TaxID=51239 RepID=A0A835UV22_VANPL|nr:hypothetical protein HPP92_014653 [Vanilla planifolia]KAG0474533.1 hypothetical protein HPP92_014219 [Vanilla planifolia]